MKGEHQTKIACTGPVPLSSESMQPTSKELDAIAHGDRPRTLPMSDRYCPKIQNSCANASALFRRFFFSTFFLCQVFCCPSKVSSSQYTVSFASQPGPDVYTKLNPYFFFAGCRTMNRMKMNSNTKQIYQSAKSTNSSPKSKPLRPIPLPIPMSFS